ncbi:MAG: F0F1 ATP synthase subunit alpha, partial [Erysipelotrichaceae bacterium]
MNLRPEDISKIIKETISNYDLNLEVAETGSVISVGDGIALIHGLSKAMSSELLIFDNGVYGMVMNLEEDHVGAVLLGDESGVKEGDEVKRTGRIVEVPVGDALLGRVVNALGQAIDGLGELSTAQTRPIERVAPGVMTRKSVHQPLMTGLKVIDSMIPIGKGQRELIIGDRETG